MISAYRLLSSFSAAATPLLDVLAPATSPVLGNVFRKWGLSSGAAVFSRTSPCTFVPGNVTVIEKSKHSHIAHLQDAQQFTIPDVYVINPTSHCFSAAMVVNVPDGFVMREAQARTSVEFFAGRCGLRGGGNN